MKKSWCMWLSRGAVAALATFVLASPSYAVPFTNVQVNRTVAISPAGGSSQQSNSTALGLFNQTLTAPDGQTSASQKSTISVVGSVLTVAGTGNANAYLPASSGGGASAATSLLLNFSVNNYASYSSQSTFGAISSSFGVGHVALFDLTRGQSIFDIPNGVLNDVRSGLLAPGNYIYNWSFNAHTQSIDTGLFSLPSSVALTVSAVPEPSSLLFLGVALVGFVGWQSLSRKFGQA